MKNTTGLVFAVVLDGKGGAKKILSKDIAKWRPEDGVLWLHLDYKKKDAKQWLRHDNTLDSTIIESLTTEETRPRSFVYKGGMMLILRGINLNPGAELDDMISIRLWIDAGRIITLRHRNVTAIDDLQKALEAQNGPTGPGTFLEELCDGMTIRMGDAISDIDDAVDALEDEVLAVPNREFRHKIADIRRTAIAMRRYLAPQRDVMVRLYNEKVDWLNDIERMRLREISDRVTRYVEDLDSIRERASVTQEELNNHLAEQMNKTMYVLSIVAGLFLPLGLLTGLFGINVGGIPGTENKWAFVIFCILLLGIAGAEIWLFKRKKWM
ncbi:MAG: zinc transporter ZntB [Lentisphaeria bacterium]